MESPINIRRLEGFGGWLILFQARMAACIVFLLAVRSDAMLIILFVLSAALCLLMFYMRCMAFRAVYIAAAVLALAISITALPENALCLMVSAAAEAAIIPALFASRRVKNTFYTCARAAEVRFERGAEYVRCIDAILAGQHCTR